MDGQVVRLKRGLAAEKVVYSNDPVAVAREWQDAGADWLHLVDLDAAFSGEPQNFPQIESICAAVDVPCQLGGGMRNQENITAALDRGVQRVIIGTKASESMDFVKEACSEFGGERIAVGIDAKNGLVAIKGWTETTASRAIDLALSAQEAGAGTVIYTDIATDARSRIRRDGPCGAPGSPSTQPHCQWWSLPSRGPPQTCRTARALWGHYRKSTLRKKNCATPSPLEIIRLTNLPTFWH